jgi:hypothetical protein
MLGIAEFFEMKAFSRWLRWLMRVVFGPLVYPMCTRGDQLDAQFGRRRGRRLRPADVDVGVHAQDLAGVHTQLGGNQSGVD